LIKSNRNDIYNVVLLNFQRIFKESITFSTKMLSSAAVFSVSEGFLKDHVTPRTGVIAAENSALASH